MTARTQVLWSLSIEQRPEGYYYSQNDVDWRGPYDDLKDMVEMDLARALYQHLEGYCRVFLKQPAH